MDNVPEQILSCMHNFSHHQALQFQMLKSLIAVIIKNKKEDMELSEKLSQ